MLPVVDEDDYVICLRRFSYLDMWDKSFFVHLKQFKLTMSFFNCSGTETHPQSVNCLHLLNVSTTFSNFSSKYPNMSTFCAYNCYLNHECRLFDNFSTYLQLSLMKVDISPN